MTVYTKITAAGQYVPARVVTNDELAAIMTTNDEWIQAHTGIVTRHFAMDQENTSSLATEVAQQLLTKSGLAAREIDLIIVTTITPDALTPATACLVQANIGADQAFAFDMSAACAGFTFGLSTADKFIRSGQYQNVMVISAEVNSKMMDFKDRTAAVFFGDGAGGVLLQPTTDPAENSILAEKLQTQGNATVIHSGRVRPITTISADNYPQTDAFYQAGREVFKFATTVVPQQMKTLLQTAQLAPTDLQYVICHQANLRIIEQIADNLALPMTKFPHNVQKFGNTSSAGVAMALAGVFDQLTGPVLLTAFGGGLAYGSILIKK
ncbi:beta-ketoacyl-ACP synthase III [Lactiplantibacillus sp. WILCCON 0030]|uniref:Beta-ketoacyl-[acyl-carrier-protein] synthase III n=1 Tax=Lactiplantibacillus brownii TaxID=3069269 RepID=A0ABU1A742_9LACO|nr:beta-ketoacyl-ACP synthase III [Lactiplantibacillus brownii]MDQ7936495.1 beta-ketoacyl-ACP synthase III [Lactiplantibacillus brownii]